MGGLYVLLGVLAILTLVKKSKEFRKKAYEDAKKTADESGFCTYMVYRKGLFMYDVIITDGDRVVKAYTFIPGKYPSIKSVHLG